jgi:hypothetical protein
MTQTEKRNLVQQLVSRAAVYAPFDGEAIRITTFFVGDDLAYDEDPYFIGEGEESGDNVSVLFDEVDLDYDSFYEMTLMRVADLQQLMD